MVTPFDAMNVVGLLAFAVAGTLKGADADLDLFGVAVLGFLTALGGGILREVFVGRVPAALQSLGDVSVAALGVVVGVVAALSLGDRVRKHTVFLVSDAVGLAAFSATGALVGVAAGVSPVGVVVLAGLTGVGGGSLADLLLTRVPSVLHEDFYATPAVLGGAVFWTVGELDGASPLPTLACAGFVFGLRVVALRRDWQLPSV